MPAFEYQRLDTPVHRLHALTKFSILAVVTLLMGFVLDPVYKIPLLIAVIIYAAFAKFRLKEIRKLILLVAVSLFLANFISSVFIVRPGLFKHYDPIWAAHVLFQITPEGFPVFGRTAITYGGLLWLTAAPLTGVAVVIMMATHVNTTSLNETVQALSSLRAPFPVIYMTTVALRFTPELMSQFTLIHRAQTLRGWRVNTRNPVKVIRLYAPLLVPLARHVIKSIDITTMSTQNRAFGLGPVTNMSEGRMSSKDRIIITSAWLFFAISMVLILGFNIGTL